ncbi:MAG: PA2779 family protein, partial [Nevskiaceae bacterium]
MRAKSFLIGLLATSLVLSTMPARAGMIGTAELLAPAADAQRERVDAFLARADVRQQFEALGVDPAEAAQRVAGLTEAELASLSENIESLPAGAGAVEA